MLDRELSQHEVQELVSTANDLGIGQEEVHSIHADFVRSLALLAWADDVVTEDEERELRAVTQMLRVSEQIVDELLAEPVKGEAEQKWSLTPGDRIALTGNMELPRELWIQRATSAGLVVGSVTKKTKLVVAADLDSLSGKAKKACGYGLPIVNEETFAKLLGAMQLGDQQAGGPAGSFEISGDFL